MISHISQAANIISRILTGGGSESPSVSNQQKKDCIEEAIERIGQAFISAKDCIAALFGCEKSSRPMTALDVIIEKGKNIIGTHVSPSAVRSMKERDVKAVTVISLDNEIVGFHAGKIDTAYRGSISTFSKKAGEEMHRSLIGKTLNPLSRLTVTTIYLESPKSPSPSSQVTLQYHVTRVSNNDTAEEHSTMGTRDITALDAARSAIDHLLRDSNNDPKNCKQELSRFFFERR